MDKSIMEKFLKMDKEDKEREFRRSSDLAKKIRTTIDADKDVSVGLVCTVMASLWISFLEAAEVSPDKVRVLMEHLLAYYNNRMKDEGIGKK